MATPRKKRKPKSAAPPRGFRTVQTAGEIPLPGQLPIPRAPSRKGKRNYKAEYRRRKALAEERGLSAAAARGHPGKGELGAAERKRLLRIVTGGYTGTKGRIEAANQIAEYADVISPVHLTQIDRRRMRDREGLIFVDAMMALQLAASRHDAYTLWFSP